MNSINPLKYLKGDVAFFSWECLTLKLENRDINLVIKNQEDMSNLLMFLINRLNTIDGKKDSGLGILNLAKSNEAKKKLSHKLMLKTLKKYKILIIRNKLSF